LEAAFVVPEGNSWNSETAQRSLLSVGDQFLIPPGNCYRLENHSESTKAILSYTVILHNRYVAGLDHHDAKMPHVARTASSDHDDTRWLQLSQRTADFTRKSKRKVSIKLQVYKRIYRLFICISNV
jgi:hypothetical protein